MSYTMTAPSPPIPTSIEIPLPTIQLSTNKENPIPPSLTLSVQLAETRSIFSLRSPCPGTENLSLTSPSPTPIPPRTLLPPFLRVPMSIPNLTSSPHSTVGEEILLELQMVEDISQHPSSPVYCPTSPPPDPIYDAQEHKALEAATILEEMKAYTLDAGFTPGLSEAIRLAISPVLPPTPNSEHRIPPSEEEVHNIQKLARAILRYRQAYPILLDVVKEWTDHLMTAIRVMSHSSEPAFPIPITDDAFDNLSHLRFIPIFTDLIDPYMEDSDESVDTPPPTLLHHIPTPAEMAHAST